MSKAEKMRRSVEYGEVELHLRAILEPEKTPRTRPSKVQVRRALRALKDYRLATLEDVGGIAKACQISTGGAASVLEVLLADGWEDERLPEMSPGLREAGPALRIYVAGSTRNVERAARFVERVRASELLDLVEGGDWVAPVLENRAAGVSDSDLSDLDRGDHAGADAEAILRADAFVLLAEEEPTGRGAWFEAGLAAMAYAFSYLTRNVESERRPALVVSGGGKRSIFTSRHFEILGVKVVAAEFVQGSVEECDDAALLALELAARSRLRG